MPAGPLTARLAALCDEVAPRLSAAALPAVREVRGRLDEPLRVAVAGRLKAGKSTLVNALIGRRVAQTAVGECTRVVTRFRYGTSDLVEVVHRDGRRSSLPLDDDGMIPRRLGVPADRVACLDVTLTSDRLRDLTVVDTPGLSSTDAAVSAAAYRQLSGSGDAAPLGADLDADSAGAITAAEAVLYVFTQSVRADDVRALTDFRAAAQRLASSPINSVGLLNKVDKLVAAAADPWPVAVALADEQVGTLSQVVCDVVPVVGLLAETTAAGRLTAADGQALRVLAGLPPAARAVLLASVDLFVGQDCPVPRQRRERLLALLDLYGVGFAVAQLAARPQLGTGEVVRLLYAASGFARLRHTLDEAFRWRADAIKAGWALSRLERLGGHGGDRELLGDAVERVVSQPEYHRLRLLDAAGRVARGAVRLPEPMARELQRLAVSDDPGWILGPSAPTGPGSAPAGPVQSAGPVPPGGPAPGAAAALAAAARWRAYAVGGASPAQARVAMVAHRGFYLLGQRLRGGSR